MGVDNYNSNKITLYRGLNDWQLRSTPEEVKRHYHRRHLINRLTNRNQHAFLQKPEQAWDTEILSMKFRQNKVFPPDSAWISLERDIIHGNANFINCDQTDYIITGGPVKLLSWCPNISDNRQILAILVSHGNASHELEINPKENTDSIQIWDFGNSTLKLITPKLLHSFEHQWGSITSMQWISPDEPNSEAVQQSLSTNNTSQSKSQPLYGHILFCCTDGFMRICPIPKFSYDQIKGDKRKILQFNPEFVLKLGLGHDYLNDGRALFGYPTCANWNSLNYGWFVAGYSSGHIGVFDLTCVNLFHYDCVHHYLISIHKRRLSYYPITGISTCPSDWCTFNYTVNSGDPSQCNYVYKFVDRTVPVVVIESDSVVRNCVWPSRGDILVSVPVAKNRVDITSILSRKVVSIPAKGIVNIASFDKDNSLLVTTEVGSVEVISFNEYAVIERLMTASTNTDKIAATKTVRHYRMLNSEDSMGDNVQSLVDCISQKDVIKLYGTATSVRYPVINTVDINPNITSAGWVAVGFNCGIVHLLKIGESDMFKAEEQFSMTLKLPSGLEKISDLKDAKFMGKLEPKIELTGKTKEDLTKDRVRKLKRADSKTQSLQSVVANQMKRVVNKEIEEKDVMSSSKEITVKKLPPVCTDISLVPYVSDEDTSIDNIDSNSVQDKREDGKGNTAATTLLNTVGAQPVATTPNTNLDKTFSVTNDNRADVNDAESGNDVVVEMFEAKSDETQTLKDTSAITVSEIAEEEFVNSVAEDIASLATVVMAKDIHEAADNRTAVPSVDAPEEDLVNWIANDIASSTFNSENNTKNSGQPEDVSFVEIKIGKEKPSSIIAEVDVDDLLNTELNVETNSKEIVGNVDKDSNQKAIFVEEVQEISTLSEVKIVMNQIDEVREEALKTDIYKNKDSKIQIIFDDSDLCVNYSDYVEEKFEEKETVITKSPGNVEAMQTLKKSDDNMIIMSGNIFERITQSIGIIEPCNYEPTKEIVMAAASENVEDDISVFNNLPVADTVDVNKVIDGEEIGLKDIKCDGDLDATGGVSITDTVDVNQVIDGEEMGLKDNKCDGDLDETGGVSITDTVDVNQVIDGEEMGLKDNKCDSDLDETGGVSITDTTDANQVINGEEMGLKENKCDGDLDEKTGVSITEIVDSDRFVPTEGKTEIDAKDDKIDVRIDLVLGDQTNVVIEVKDDKKVQEVEEDVRKEMEANVPTRAEVYEDKNAWGDIFGEADTDDEGKTETKYFEIPYKDIVKTTQVIQEAENCAPINKDKCESDYKEEEQNVIDRPLPGGDSLESKVAVDEIVPISEEKQRSAQPSHTSKSKRKLLREFSPEIEHKKIRLDTDVVMNIGDNGLSGVEKSVGMNGHKDTDIIEMVSKDEGTTSEEMDPFLACPLKTAVVSIERSILCEDLKGEEDINLRLKLVRPEESGTKSRRSTKSSKNEDDQPTKINYIKHDPHMTIVDQMVSRDSSVPIKKRSRMSKDISDNNEKDLKEPEHTKESELIKVRNDVAQKNKRCKRSLAQAEFEFEKTENEPKKMKQEKDSIIQDSSVLKEIRVKKSVDVVKLITNDSKETEAVRLKEHRRGSRNVSVEGSTKKGNTKDNVGRDETIDVGRKIDEKKGNTKDNVGSKVNENKGGSRKVPVVVSTTIGDGKGDEKGEGSNTKGSTKSKEKEDDEMDGGSLNVSVDGSAKKGGRKSKTAGKYWLNLKIAVEWVEGKYKGVQQVITGRLFDEEPEVGKISRVRWSKPTSSSKYPARVIEIIT